MGNKYKKQRTKQPVCLAWDLDEKGRMINVMLIQEKRPEKIYTDFIDHYGDKRDFWAAIDFYTKQVDSQQSKEQN